MDPSSGGAGRKKEHPPRARGWTLHYRWRRQQQQQVSVGMHCTFYRKGLDERSGSIRWMAWQRRDGWMDGTRTRAGQPHAHPSLPFGMPCAEHGIPPAGKRESLWLRHWPHAISPGFSARSGGEGDTDRWHAVNPFLVAGGMGRVWQGGQGSCGLAGWPHCLLACFLWGWDLGVGV